MIMPLCEPHARAITLLVWRAFGAYGQPALGRQTELVLNAALYYGNYFLALEEDNDPNDKWTDEAHEADMNNLYWWQHRRMLTREAAVGRAR